MATMNSIDSSKGRLRGTYIAIMIPLGVAINYVGGQIATSLGLPIYLDSIGTIIVASIMGPWIGATSGVLYNIISSLVQGNIMASLFGLCNIGSGLIVGYMARYGKYKNILHVIIATVLVSLWNSIVANLVDKDIACVIAWIILRKLPANMQSLSGGKKKEEKKEEAAAPKAE